MQRISIIGSGNVATHLGVSLSRAGIQIVEIYSPTYANARALADKTGAKVLQSVSELDQSVDLCIISVPDRAMEELVAKLPKDLFVVHTSGSLPMSIFELHCKRFGVFYPLQTFSKEREIDFSEIPVCIESNYKELDTCLQELAKKLSNKVYQLSSDQRKEIHIAAVFACNFSNHLYAIAHELLNEKDVPFEIIKPLIQETAQKVLSHDPASVQTGPAIRKDQITMDSHLDALKSSEADYSDIYKMLSESIMKFNSDK